MNTAWKIARRGRACSACGRAFEDGEAHFSILRLAEGLERSDRCVPCFQGSPAPGEEFYWKTRFARDPRRRIAIDVDALREAFLRLPPEGDRGGLRYLVALLLLRKRALRLVETRRGEGAEPDMLVLSPGKGSPERFEVAVPPISAEGIEGLRKDLRALLGLEEAQGGEARGEAGPPGGERPPGDPGGILGESGGEVLTASA